jgi:site-specific DNA-methyltransferase (adenine-specific)
MISDSDESWHPQLSSLPTDHDRTYILRPHDLEHSFAPSENTWYFPRVAGTFKERAGFHGCQMPEQLLGRIIRTCSNPGDMVLDPFSGSATTLAVAKKLGRCFIGFDISKAYVKYGLQRLSNIRIGRNLKSRETKFSKIQSEMTYEGIIEAFRLTHDGFSSDRVVVDPDINKEFIATCEKLGLAGDARTWNILLFRLRKQGKLAHFETIHRTSIPWDECDKYIFASEIAWQIMIDDGSARSLDEILCDPVLTAKFDETAGRFAPGYQPLNYRWAALKLRKEAKYARCRAAILTPPTRMGKKVPIKEMEMNKLSHEPGLYVLSERTRKLYVGETLDLSGRFTTECCQAWTNDFKPVFVQTLAMDPTTAGRLAWQSCLVKKLKPRFNSYELRSVS